VAEAFALDDQTRNYLATRHERPVFNDHGRYIHITTYAPREEEAGALHALECVVGENWVVTAYNRPIRVLEEVAERVSGSGDTGSLDRPGFLAALLEVDRSDWPPGSVIYRGESESATLRATRTATTAVAAPATNVDVQTWAGVGVCVLVGDFALRCRLVQRAVDRVLAAALAPARPGCKRLLQHSTDATPRWALRPVTQGRAATCCAPAAPSLDRFSPDERRELTEGIWGPAV
jgi:hypothetical protein